MARRASAISLGGGLAEHPKTARRNVARIPHGIGLVFIAHLTDWMAALAPGAAWLSTRARPPVGAPRPPVSSRLPPARGIRRPPRRPLPRRIAARPPRCSPARWLGARRRAPSLTVRAAPKRMTRLRRFPRFGWLLPSRRPGPAGLEGRSKRSP